MRHFACFLVLRVSTFLVVSWKTASSLGPDDYREGNPEYVLFKRLFTNYSDSVRPVRNVTEIVPLSFDIGFSQIVNLHEKKQILMSNLWVRLEWHDPWLTWNESEFGGLQRLNVEPHMVWKPDIVLYNNVNADSNGEMYLFTTKVLVFSSGKVRWLSPIQVQSECKIDITNFPLDDQQCKLEFGSWTYDGHQLNLTNARETADFSMYTVNGEWEMLSGNCERKISYFTCCKAPYITLIYTFHLRRRALFYFMNLILPCVLLTFLSALTFRFPPESGERVSLTITILLGMTVFMMIFIDNIPPTSEVVPLIGRYFSCSVIIMASSLVATCISLSFYYNKPSEQIPFWLRFLTFKCLGPILGVRPPKQAFSKNIKALIEKQSAERGLLMNDSIEKRRKHNLHPNSAMKKLESTSLLSQSTSFPNNLEKTQQPVIRVIVDSEVPRCHSEQTPKSCTCCCCCTRNETTRNIEHEARKEEWHYVAAVVDRAFFYLFIIVICLCACIVFLISPARGMFF